MLSFSVPPGYRRKAEIRRPKLDGFTEIIDQWLREDIGQHRKQRHTAKRVFDRLRTEHGFVGGYTIVKDYMREHRRRGREMYVPLAHDPAMARRISAKHWCGLAELNRRRTTSPLTFHTAIPVISGPTRRRRLKPGWMAM